MFIQARAAICDGTTKGKTNRKTRAALARISVSATTSAKPKPRNNEIAVPATEVSSVRQAARHVAGEESARSAIERSKPPPLGATAS